MLTRREAITGIVSAAVASTLPLSAQSKNEKFSANLKALEAKSGGRIGCAVLNSKTGKLIGYKLDERFSMCSTSKLLVAAFVLHRVDIGAEHLDRKIILTAKPTLPNSPITAQHVGPQGITIAELCAAAIELSDNTAANLLLDSFGGPAKLTQYLQSTGDTVTRLDRTEPELNTALHGDPRDTASPASMAATMRHHLAGNALSKSSRNTFANWLLNCKTGDARLRAGLTTLTAAGWTIGDKTGTGSNGTSNDMAILYPPPKSGRASAPIFLTAFLTESPLTPAQREPILAEVGTLVAKILRPA